MVKVATYNMSFASDQGLNPHRASVFESEGNLLATNIPAPEAGKSWLETNPPLEQRRQLWNNALKLVKHFWQHTDGPAVMGLQEINDTEFCRDILLKDYEKKERASNAAKNAAKNDKTETQNIPAEEWASLKDDMNNFNGGTVQITKDLLRSELKTKTTDYVTHEGYKQCAPFAPKYTDPKITPIDDYFDKTRYSSNGSIAVSFWGPAWTIHGGPSEGVQRPCVGLIWNEKELGKMVKDYGADLGTHSSFISANIKGQYGRPVYMVQTAKGYLLINLHSPNNPAQSENGMPALHIALNDHIKNAIDHLQIENQDIGKIFIMGDFNDRYDGLQEITLMESKLTYKGDAPLSCCYNGDSSCKNDDVKSVESKSKTRSKKTEITTCKNTPGYKLVGPGKRQSMGEDGYIENYKYYGDKVFGKYPSTVIKMYRPTEVKSSKESDHEMVYAEYSDSDIGKSEKSSHKGKKTEFRGGRRTRKHKNNGRKHQTRRR